MMLSMFGKFKYAWNLDREVHSLHYMDHLVDMCRKRNHVLSIIWERLCREFEVDFDLSACDKKHKCQKIAPTRPIQYFEASPRHYANKYFNTHPVSPASMSVYSDIPSQSAASGWAAANLAVRQQIPPCSYFATKCVANPPRSVLNIVYFLKAGSHECIIKIVKSAKVNKTQYD